MGLFFNNQDIANAGVAGKAVLYSRSRFSWELSEIGAAKPDGARLLREAPAAFGRLCVETKFWEDNWWSRFPAAFGRLCVETFQAAFRGCLNVQPPSGGCVLKRGLAPLIYLWICQPPSGGCVLKLGLMQCRKAKSLPAAFGRLCVETNTRAWTFQAA